MYLLQFLAFGDYALFLFNNFGGFAGYAYYIKFFKI